MDYGTKYLTYSEYQNLNGSLNNESAFNLLEYKSRKIIDKYTFNRFNGVITLPTELKVCMRDMIELVNSYETELTRNKGISSESADGYSISYNTPTKDLETAKNVEIKGIIDNYLSNTKINNIPVLYRGADE